MNQNNYAKRNRITTVARAVEYYNDLFLEWALPNTSYELVSRINRFAELNQNV